jgi:hypothetical protein
LVVNEDFSPQPIATHSGEARLLHSRFSHHRRVFEGEPRVRDHEDPNSADWVIEKTFVGLELCDVEDAESQPRECSRGIE